MGACYVFARPAAAWVAERWPLPEPGEIPTFSNPWPQALLALVFLLPLGATFSRLAASQRLASPCVATFLGGCVALVLHPLVALRTLGIAGTIGIAGVVTIVAASLAFLVPLRGSSKAPSSYGLSAALGLAFGAIEDRLDLGGGGTAFSMVFPALLVASAAALAELVRPVLPRAGSMTRGRRIERLACVVAVPILVYLSARAPSTASLLEASSRVEATIDGRIPSFATLAPLPALLTTVAFLVALAGGVASLRAIGVVFLVATATRLAASYGDVWRIAWLGAAIMTLCGAIFGPSGALDPPRQRSTRVTIGVAGLFAVVAYIVTGTARRSASDRDAPTIVRPLDAASAQQLVEGLLLPNAPCAPASMDRLILQLVAWGDEPLSCLVLGPGGVPWVERWLTLTNLRIDYVTPVAEEAQFIVDAGLHGSRLHTLVASPRRYLEASDRKYDRIVVVPPEPPWRSSFQRRTHEWRDLLCMHLQARGIVGEIQSLRAMSKQNLLSRALDDAATDRPDGVVIVDHPRSADPQLALMYGMESPRFDVDRVVREKKDARELLLGVVCGASVLRLSARLIVTNRDDRPWLEGAMRARTTPAPEFALATLATLASLHGMAEDRIVGSEDVRGPLIASARRDHEAMHHWYALRATLGFANLTSSSAVTAPLDLAEPEAPPRSTAELDVLERAFQRSPDLSYLRRLLVASVRRLEAVGDPRGARELVNHGADAEARYFRRHPELMGAAARLELGLERAQLLARQCRRAQAIRAFEQLLDDENVGREARIGLGCLLAYGGRVARERARELILDESVTAAVVESPELRDAIARARAFLNGDRSAALEALQAEDPKARESAAARYLEAWSRN